MQTLVQKLIDQGLENRVLTEKQLAQAFVQGSYISFETALAYHGWIPEAIYTTSSVTPGRKTLTFESGKFGHYSFHPLAVNTGQFLVLVQRILITQQTILVAEPLRARR